MSRKVWANWPFICTDPKLVSPEIEVKNKAPVSSAAQFYNMPLSNRGPVKLSAVIPSKGFQS